MSNHVATQPTARDYLRIFRWQFLTVGITAGVLYGSYLLQEYYRPDLNWFAVSSLLYVTLFSFGVYIFKESHTGLVCSIGISLIYGLMLISIVALAPGWNLLLPAAVLVFCMGFSTKAYVDAGHRRLTANEVPPILTTKVTPGDLV